MDINNIINMDKDEYIRVMYLVDINSPKTPKEKILDLLQENPELVDEVMFILRQKKIQKIKNKK